MREREREGGRTGGRGGQKGSRGGESLGRAGGGSAGMAISAHCGLAAECCQQLLPGATETNPHYWLHQPG